MSELTDEQQRIIQDATSAAATSAAAATAAAAAAKAAAKAVEQACGTALPGPSTTPASPQTQQIRSENSAMTRQQYLREKVDPVFVPLLQALVDEQPEEVPAFIAARLQIDPARMSSVVTPAPSNPPEQKVIMMPSYTDELDLLKRENARMKTELKRLVKQVHDTRETAEKEELLLHARIKAQEIMKYEVIDNNGDQSISREEFESFQQKLRDEPLQQKRKLLLLHMNDVYMYEAGKKEPVGGASRMATLCKSFQVENPLIIHSGDFLSPSTTSNSKYPKRAQGSKEGRKDFILFFGHHQLKLTFMPLLAFEWIGSDTWRAHG